MVALTNGTDPQSATAALFLRQALGGRCKPQIEVAGIERLLVVAECRVVGGCRHRKAGRQASVEQPGAFELLETRQIVEPIEPELRQEIFRGAVGQRTARRLAAA